MPYCARTDVYAIGLPAEAFVRPPRAVEGVIPGTGTLALRNHALALDAPITLAVMSSSTLGAPAAAVPGGSSVGVPYFARPNGSDLFQIATAVSPASPIAIFTDSGAGVFGIIVDHGAYLDAAIVAASAVIDEYARAYSGPIAAPILPLVCAFLAARIYVATHRALMPEQKAGEEEAPSWVRSMIDKLFAVWLSGAPMAAATDSTPSVVEEGAVVFELEGRRFLDGDRA